MIAVRCAAMLLLLIGLSGCTPARKLPERPPVGDPELAAGQVVRIIDTASVNAQTDRLASGVLLWREQIHVPELAWSRMAISLGDLRGWSAREATGGVWKFEVRTSTAPDADLVPAGYRAVTVATFSIRGLSDAADFGAALEGLRQR